MTAEFPSASPAFVLTMAYYGGTLAATRCLGDRGVPVIMADAQRMAPALWSRHVVRREKCPPPRPIGRFIDWLLALGERDPGHVLYATSDDLAWAFAERAAELQKSFRLLTPPFATIARLLDKRALYAACTEAGIRTPWTWSPEGDDDPETVVRDAPFPVMVKPRTQVLFTSMRKGVIATSADELREAYRRFLRANRYDAPFLEGRPDLERPMVQEYCPGEGEPIYCISGYCDTRHDLFVARAARKLVQWPRRAGIGICFEDAPVDDDLAASLRRMCTALGFFGVFEAEFVRRRAEWLLIDFNPRFFGQMGFDVARALPAAYFVYLAALGDLQRLRAEVQAARTWQAAGPMFFVNKTSLRVTTVADWLVGRAPEQLGGFRDANSTRVFDFAEDRRDWVPGLIDGVLQVTGALRHAKGLLRSAAGGT